PPTDGGDRPRILGAIFQTPTHTWFIKATGLSAALDPHRDGFVQLCRSVRFDAAGTAPLAGAGGPTAAGASGAGEQPDFPEAPEAWTRDATPKPMAVASYTVRGAGGQEASLTVTPLGGSQDLLANVNRWRRQVGLSPLESLSEHPPEKIRVDGEHAWLVDMHGA